MAFILPIEEPWTSQPQVEVGIDWRNPLTRGLTTAVLPHLGFDAVSREIVGVLGTKPAVVPGGNGLAISPSAGSITLSSMIAKQVSAPPLTVLVIMTRTGSMAQYARVVDCAYGASVDGGWDIEADGSGGLVFVSWSGGSFSPLSSVGLTIGAPSVFAATHDGVKATAYLDGLLKQGPMSRTISATTKNEPFAIGSTRNGTNFGAGCLIFAVMTFGRVLPAEEIASLSANPWQLFAP